MKKTYDEICKEYYYLRTMYECTHMQEKSSAPPFEVLIEASSYCNIACTHCAHSVMKRKKGLMTLDLFKKIIEDVAPYKPFISYHLDGEPLLHKQIIDFVRLTHEYGLKDALVTNTTLLNRTKSKELIEAGLKYVIFSMSGATKEVYESVHVKAKFDKTLGNILDFLEVKDELGAYHVRTRSVFVEEEKTQKDKERYLAMFSKIPIDDVSISPMFNFYGLNKEVNWEIDKNNYRPCLHPWKFLGISASGNIRACAFDYEDRYIIGNAKTDNVIECWNNERMKRFRRSLLNCDFENENQSELCSKCNEMSFDPANCSSQWPEDYELEAGKLFTRGYPEAFLSDEKIFKKKMEYLRENRDAWFNAMVNGQVI